jgi:hypothetical protein
MKMSPFIRRHKQQCTLFTFVGVSLAAGGAYLLTAGIADPDILKVLFGGGLIAIGALTALCYIVARFDYG